ncbi:MAG: cell division protein SepF [Elainellaceae cyanobacterium]
MSFLNRIQDILGVADELPHYDDEYSELGYEHASNVVEMPGIVTNQSELLVMEPRSFEEVPEAILALRDRKAVILNLNSMDTEEAQRSVDYVAGGVFAMDGHQERINQNVFLFTPISVHISNYPVGVSSSTPLPQGLVDLGNETDEQLMLKRLKIKQSGASDGFAGQPIHPTQAGQPFRQHD